MVTWAHWHTEPALVGVILAAVWCYAMLAGPLRRAIDPEALFPVRESICFGLAVVVFYVAVGSPLDALGESFLFSAHMVQHNLLMYVIPVLGMWALPGWMLDAVLDRFRVVRVTIRFLTHPVVAGFIFTFFFCGWHFPVLYEAALRDKTIHIVEHLTMFLGSVLMVWPILNRSHFAPRMGWGAQILYVFVLMVVQTPLFAILTFSPEVLYPTYEYAPRVMELSPKADQVLGGLIMKVANMVFSLAVLGYAFYRWNREQGSEERRYAVIRDRRLRRPYAEH